MENIITYQIKKYRNIKTTPKYNMFLFLISIYILFGNLAKWALNALFRIQITEGSVIPKFEVLLQNNFISVLCIFIALSLGASFANRINFEEIIEKIKIVKDKNMERVNNLEIFIVVLCIFIINLSVIILMRLYSAGIFLISFVFCLILYHIYEQNKNIFILMIILGGYILLYAFLILITEEIDLNRIAMTSFQLEIFGISVLDFNILEILQIVKPIFSLISVPFAIILLIFMFRQELFSLLKEIKPKFFFNPETESKSELIITESRATISERVKGFFNFEEKDFYFKNVVSMKIDQMKGHIWSYLLNIFQLFLLAFALIFVIQFLISKIFGIIEEFYAIASTLTIQLEHIEETILLSVLLTAFAFGLFISSKFSIWMIKSIFWEIKKMKNITLEFRMLENEKEELLISHDFNTSPVEILKIIQRRHSHEL